MLTENEFKTCMDDAVNEAVAGASRSAGYDPAHFVRLAAIEEEHFWFTARRKLIFQLVSAATRSLAPGFRVLEVGCGNGTVLGALEQACPAGTVFGMDLFSEGLSFASSQGRKRLLQGDAHNPPFNIDFDVIGAFDVIEHLPDDEKILHDFHRMLRPGGKLIVTVPAYRWLWSEFDDVSHHCRRYHRPELQTKLHAAGFTPSFISPFMMSILPLVWLHRKKRRANHSRREDDILGEEIRIIPVVNPILRSILSAECALAGRGVALPFGTSLVAVATKV
jgi:SAM-dependent methyltransferase